uniref:CHHC U11-48K-type domain-containing protein n=1 Tax=Lygus hesperus TaxID=30085 RepID=A0A0K8SYH8_LYGHE
MSETVTRRPGSQNPSNDPQPSEPVLSCSGGFEGFYTYKMNGVDLVICPFNRAHIMLAKRLQYHLRKCVIQHKGEKIKCPYNASEYIGAEDYVTHLTICPSRQRRIVHEWNSKQTKKNPNLVASPPIDRTVPYVIEEYW